MLRLLPLIFAFVCCANGCKPKNRPRELEDPDIIYVRYEEYEYIPYEPEGKGDKDDIYGGLLNDNVKPIENSRACHPKLRLCSKVRGVPVCRKAVSWQRDNFNKNAASWTIKSPLVTSRNKTNCCFKIYEYPGYSIQGNYKLIKPGTSEEIFWNIRSLKKSEESCIR